MQFEYKITSSFFYFHRYFIGKQMFKSKQTHHPQTTNGTTLLHCHPQLHMHHRRHRNVTTHPFILRSRWFRLCRRERDKELFQEGGAQGQARPTTEEEI